MISEPREPVIIIGDPKKIIPETREEREQHSFLLKLIASVLLVVLGVGAFLLRPGMVESSGTIVMYKEGVPLGVFLHTLKDQSIIRSVLLTRGLMLLYGNDQRVASGEYFFGPSLWLPSVAKQIARSEHHIPVKKVTFPEGMSVREMGETLVEAFPLFDVKTFREKAESQEGYLFPNTYHFFATVAPDTVINLLRKEFDDQIKPYQGDIERSGHTLGEIITMASILEGEVKTDRDRKLVSGILWKRIARGMPLQVDAPFAYLLGKESSELSMKDLSSDSPYNTYRHKGLPPIPINNPGVEAISATLSPEGSPYLFYLSDHDGVIHYAKTFDEHKANKARYIQ